MSKKHTEKKRDKRQAVSRTVYLMILILVAFYVSKFGGALPYTLFYAVLIYPFVSFAYLLYQRSAIRLFQEVPGRELDKNSETDYRLTIENAGIFPVAGIHLFMRKAGVTFAEDLARLNLSLLPGERREYATGLSCRYAGSYVIGADGLRFYDCFGLFSLYLKNPNPLRVQVLPKAGTGEEDELPDLPLAEAAGGRDEDDVLGNDMASYTGAEPVSRIHWKNYARRGELSVRRPEVQGVDMVSVALLTDKNDESEEGLARRDTFLSFAVSVAGYYVKLRKPVRFFFYNAGVQTSVIGSASDLSDFCRNISKELVLGEEKSRIDAKVVDAMGRSGERHFLVREGEEKLCPI